MRAPARWRGSTSIPALPLSHTSAMPASFGAGGRLQVFATEQVDAADVDAVVGYIPDDGTALAVPPEPGHAVLGAERADPPLQGLHGGTGRLGRDLIPDEKDPAVTIAAGVGMHRRPSIGAPRGAPLASGSIGAGSAGASLSQHRRSRT